MVFSTRNLLRRRYLVLQATVVYRFLLPYQVASLILSHLCYSSILLMESATNSLKYQDKVKRVEDLK